MAPVFILINVLYLLSRVDIFDCLSSYSSLNQPLAAGIETTTAVNVFEKKASVAFITIITLSLKVKECTHTHARQCSRCILGIW